MASAAPAERTAFIRQTYLHLGFAILGFIVVEWFLLNQSWSAALIQKMVGGMGWLIVLGAFMGISFIAEEIAGLTFAFYKLKKQRNVTEDAK